ncbi:MAG: hypothetical protein QM736_24815 [Vicinamibacterales bacterium]
MVMILSAMASGAVTVLGPSLRLAGSYCMLLLLQVSSLFLMDGTYANGILGFLGVAFCAILCQLSRTSHKAMLASIRLGMANRGLVLEMKDAYSELSKAQRELQRERSSRSAHTGAHAGFTERDRRAGAVRAGVEPGGVDRLADRFEESRELFRTIARGAARGVGARLWRGGAVPRSG